MFAPSATTSLMPFNTDGDAVESDIVELKACLFVERNILKIKHTPLIENTMMMSVYTSAQQLGCSAKACIHVFATALSAWNRLCCTLPEQCVA